MAFHKIPNYVSHCKRCFLVAVESGISPVNAALGSIHPGKYLGINLLQVAQPLILGGRVFRLRHHQVGG